jgi:hypothetical protein
MVLQQWRSSFRYGVIWGLQVLAGHIRFRFLPLNGSCLDFRFSLGVAVSSDSGLGVNSRFEPFRLAEVGTGTSRDDQARDSR